MGARRVAGHPEEGAGAVASSEPNDPAWAAGLTEQLLVSAFGRETLARGQQYAAQGRVGHVSVGSGTDGTVAQAQVRGSGFHTYLTVVHQMPDGRILASCSCPVRFACKHAAAILWQLRTTALSQRTPQWQRALADIAAEAGSLGSGRPLALQVSRGSSGVVQLRPLLWGASQRWVRTGISWESLGREGGFDFLERHRAPLAGLASTRSEHLAYYGYSGRADSLALSNLTSDCWHWLRAAVEAGVALVSDRSTPPVRLSDEPATVRSRIARAGAGLHLVTGVVVGERLWTPAFPDLVGIPPHGLSLSDGSELLLAPFAQPLTPGQQTLLLRDPLLEIPEAEVGSFAAEYVPALQRRLHVEVDDDVDLPEVIPPELVLRVSFEPRQITHLTWAFRYQLGDRVFDLDLDADEQPGYRDPQAERALLDAVPEGPWPRTDAGVRAHAVLTGPETAVFVSEGIDLLKAAGVIVETTGETLTYRHATGAPQVSVSVSDPPEGTDWFDLAVTVSVDGEPVPFRDLFVALATDQTHLFLPSGTWFSLERPELDQLRRLIEEARRLQPPDAAPGLRLRPEHAGLWEDLVRLGVVAQQSSAWASAVDALLSTDRLPAPPVPAGLQVGLRPYQETGFRWLHFLHSARLGGILADDMGLGKTLQALTLAASLHEAGALQRPILVVAPTSVVTTWASEAARFTPELTVRVVEQTSAKRPQSVAELAAGCDLLVTSYTLLRLDADEYAAEIWEAVYLDEAQFVKNHQSLSYKSVRRLRASAKFAFTGTPLENNLMDLWSLLSIVAPGLFADPTVFTDLYRRPIESGSDPDALARLHRRIRPLMLRRTKRTVARELPDKQDQVLRVPLTPAHRRLYDRQLAAERKKVLGLVGDLQHNRIKVLASLTLLRRLALSPALVYPDREAVSAKIDALVDLVKELAAEGHRALVFSQFTTYLRLVRDRLHAAGVASSYLDGRTRDRAARIDGFRTGSDPVFLISLKAGGFGLTLTEADYVFILDPWWNPAAEAQAVDRTHRIGQRRSVSVYRLVSADTIEEKVVALQERKRELFAKVIDDAGDLSGALTADDIRGLLDV